MPKLDTYTAQVQPLPTTSTQRFVPQPSDISRPVARAAESLLSSVEDKESREAVVSSSAIRAKYAQELDKAALSGEDTAPIKEKMQEDHAKVAENFTTRRGQQANDLYASNNNLMFDEQANAIQVKRATAEAQLAASKFLSSASSIMQHNPGYLGFALDDADALVSTYKLSPEKKALALDSLRKELNMASAISAARLDPAGTRKKLEGGEWDLTPEQRQMAVNKADTEFRAARAEDEYLRAEAQRERVDRNDVARDRHFGQIIEGTATRRQIMDDADLTPQTREHLIVFMEHRAKELTTQVKASDPAVMRALWLRINAADTDPAKIINGTEIFNAVHAGKINTNDADKLNTMVAGQKDENNRGINTTLYMLSNSFQRFLEQDPRMSKHKVLGAVPAIVNEYTFMVQDQVAQMRAVNDVPGLRDLFTPGTKTYVGSPQFMQQAVKRVEAREQAEVKAKLPVANTRAEYDALPPGPYIGPTGELEIKPKKEGKPSSPSEPAAGYDAPMMAP